MHSQKCFPFSDREPGPVTLTFELDLDMVKVNHLTSIYVNGHLTRKLLFAYRHTHTRRSAVPGPLTWSANIG